MRPLRLLVFVCSATVCLGAEYEPVLDLTFNGETAGIPKLAEMKFETSVGDVRIVEATSEPGDPFGGDGNRSLLIEKTDVESVPVVNFLSPTPVSKGRWKYRIAAQPGGPANARALASLSYGKEKALTLQCIGARFSALGTGDAPLQFDQKIRLDRPNEVVIEFDFVRKVFSGSLNGEVLSIASLKEFPLNADVAAVNSMTFWISTKGGENFRFFFDDVQLLRAAK